MNPQTAGPALCKRSQRGVTMLEVLVTLFIITLFVLASAGVQSSAVKLNKAAQYRTAAVLLATEIGERMEANGEAAANGDYACDPCSTTTTPTTSCVDSTCTPTQLATFDREEWGKRVGDAFNGATVSIAWACASGCVATEPPSRVFGTYTVTLRWSDRRANVAYDAVMPGLTATSEVSQYVMTKAIFHDPG